MGTIGTASELAAPRLLRLAGHPLRWRLVRELIRSDRQMHEFISLLGELQSLVAAISAARPQSRVQERGQ